MGDAKVHLCFECGQKNRVPNGAEAGALCGGCGKKLYPNLAAPTKKEDKSILSTPQKKDAAWGLIVWPTVLVAVSMIGLLVYLSSSDDTYDFAGSAYNENRSTNEASTAVDYAVQPDVGTQLAPADATDLDITSESSQTADDGALPDQVEPLPSSILVPQPFEVGLLWNKTDKARVAPFQVLTEPNLKYFVKLTDRWSDEDAIGLLVEGGTPIEIDVPYGTYKMKWCAGSTWYGEEDRFGPEESCSKADSDLIFRLNGNYPEGYTIELREQIGGNLRTSEIDPSKF